MLIRRATIIGQLLTCDDSAQCEDKLSLFAGLSWQPVSVGGMVALQSAGDQLEKLIHLRLKKTESMKN